MDKNIIQIGVYDAKLTKFENQYPTPEGITYNSYLIIDDKIAVVDTVDARAADRWFDNLLSAIPQGRTPDYLIVEHLEPDHSSQIARLMHRFPDCRIICSAAAARMLPAVVGTDEFKDRITPVGEGDTLPLGSHTLTFLLAPMIHWPEVMMVYVPESGVLFSADAFGRFGHPEASEWAEEGARYYLNIVGKYGKPVQNLIAKLRDKDIRTIAPLHGPVLSGDLTPYFDLYRKWSSYEHEDDGVLIGVASIHGLTAEAALRVAELLKTKRSGKRYYHKAYPLRYEPSRARSLPYEAHNPYGLDIRWRRIHPYGRFPASPGVERLLQPLGGYCGKWTVGARGRQEDESCRGSYARNEDCRANCDPPRALYR